MNDFPQMSLGDAVTECNMSLTSFYVQKHGGLGFFVFLPQKLAFSENVLLIGFLTV
jgi:hypothetical protein